LAIKIAPKIRHAIPIRAIFVTKLPESENICNAHKTNDNPRSKINRPGNTKNCNGCSIAIYFTVDTKTDVP
jgi:hypothetical protein